MAHIDAANKLAERLNKEQVCEMTTGHKWGCLHCGKELYPPSIGGGIARNGNLSQKEEE